MERIEGGSSPPRRRTIGFVYLLYFLTSLAGGYFTNLVVVRDPAATITNLLAHEATYRTGFAFNLIGNVLYIVLTVLFYRLFERGHRTVALLMLSFSLVGCATQIVAGTLQLAALVVLHDKLLSAAFTGDQLRAAAVVNLRMYSQTFHISFVMFALFDALLGWLIVRSALLPRIIGVLMMFAGVCAATFLYPPLAIALKSFVLPAAGLAEAVLMLWLIARGVSVAHLEVPDPA